MTEKTSAPLLATLDDHRRIALSLEDGVPHSRLHLRLPENTRPEFLLRLLSQLTIEIDGAPVALTPKGPSHADADVGAPRQIQFRLNGQALAVATRHGIDWSFRRQAPPITSGECRQLGEFPTFRFYPRDSLPAASTMVVSDFHTHSSGELPGQDFIALARRLRIPYPVRLLTALGIEPSRLPDHRVMVKRIPFAPLDAEERGLPAEEPAVHLDDLSPAIVSRLSAAMDAPFDRQSSFSDMERQLYRFRYPLSKSPALIAPTLEKIGSNYARRGTRYAEITMNGLDKPDSIRAVHAAADWERRHDEVDMRFLAGVPRTFGEAQLEALFERIKVLAESPYVMGLDIIGYETNKTSDIVHLLERVATWCHANGHDEFTFRVHAGENSKNPDNVYDVLSLADRLGVRVRVGHALYGLDERTLDLAEKMARRGLVTIEFNPASNIALNNTDRIERLPFRACLDRKISFVIGSDGSGIMTTNPAELRLMLRAAGLDEAGMATIAATEQALIDRQLAYSREKAARLEAKYGMPLEKGLPAFTDDLVARTSRIPDPPQPPPDPRTQTLFGRFTREIGAMGKLRGKVPILLVGASGSSWERVSEKARRETAIAIDMLTLALDPKKVYFAHGRAKKEGVVGRLASSLATPQTPHFDVLGMITERRLEENRENHSLAPHLTHLIQIDGTRLDITAPLIGLIQRRKGIIIPFGGAAFTRDIILKASQQGLPLFLMRGVEGASEEKAEVMDPALGAADARTLIAAVERQRPELFEHRLDAAGIDALYKKAAARTDRAAHESSAEGGALNHSRQLLV